MVSLFWRIGAIASLSGLLSTPALAENLVVGAAASVVRHVEGISGPDVRLLKMSDKVFFNEVIVTQSDSASKIEFPDETHLTVGPDSRVTIDAFVYDPTGKNSKMVVNATLGVARFVTGKMGSAAYQIKTPTTTIGVRGTQLTVNVQEDGTTDTIVESGSITVQGQTGDPVEVPAGLSTTTEPGEAATDPAPPSDDVEADVANMDVTLLIDGGEQGDNDSIADEDLVEIVEEVEQTRAAGCGC